MIKKNYSIYLVLLLMLSLTSHAQLANFQLAVNKTDETCLGNGSLSFQTSGLTPNSTVIYKVYQLPDTANPVSVLVDNYIGGLSAGTYKVEAVQALGDDSNSAEQTVTINNFIQPFSFEVSSESEYCANGGTLVVNVTEGVATSYEIISGPVTAPLQESNTFTGLPTGSYNVRAFNNCGIGKVKTYTLTVINTQLAISDAVYSEDAESACDYIIVSNMITPSAGTINYPVTVEHRLALMDIQGEEVVMQQVFETGSPDSLNVTVTMPRFNETYDYSLSVTDVCGSVYENQSLIVNPNITATIGSGIAHCAEKFLIINVAKFTGSYTLEFLSYPEGFDPAAYMANYTGPFTDGHLEFGDEDNAVPFGTYVIKATDECGREITSSGDLLFSYPDPSVSASNNGCFSEFGKIKASTPVGVLVTASITAAPDSYLQSGNITLPLDVTGNILSSNGMLVLTNMPLGNYTLTFHDECGFDYTETIEVPEFVEKPFNSATLPGCEPGFGSVKLGSGNAGLTEVLVVAKPQAYTGPQNVSENIVSGKLYLGNLPQGTYIFKATDACGITHNMSVQIDGYVPPAETDFTLFPGCGSFSVKVTDASNGLEGARYWLQKLNEATGVWEHPETGVAYQEGTVPADSTGIRMYNNATKRNLAYTGQFRIMKMFQSYATGSSTNAQCFAQYATLEYYDNLAISSAYTMACVGEPNDVYVEVEGYPVSYKITQMNGEPVDIDNGDKNIFKNLAPAEYVFSIEDACGNVVTQWFNFQELPSIADATQPVDMVVCLEEGNNTTTSQFDLYSKNDEILGPLYSAMYTITYHTSQADADEGINALPQMYTNTSNGQTIYVRVVHNDIHICHATTSFRLFVSGAKVPEIITKGTVCDGIALELSVDDEFTEYLWSTGETGNSITVTEPGLYYVITTQTYGTGSCESYAEMEINTSEKPEIRSVDSKDWTDDENTITVNVSGNGKYQYSIDGITYQDSNVFEGLTAGVYSVFVRDSWGCGMDVTEVVLMNYPKYFTPNGDGEHETWYIKHAVLEPDFKAEIYDRYGKHITTFGPNSKGWDGTLNGTNLPSTDYWFVVTRQDGRQLTGHFAMLR